MKPTAQVGWLLASTMLGGLTVAAVMLCLALVQVFAIRKRWGYLTTLPVLAVSWLLLIAAGAGAILVAVLGDRTVSVVETNGHVYRLTVSRDLLDDMGSMDYSLHECVFAGVLCRKVETDHFFAGSPPPQRAWLEVTDEQPGVVIRYED